MSQRLSKKQLEELNASLFDAVGRGDAKAIKLALAQGADVNAKEGFGWTPLMSASFLGLALVVNRLLDAGAQANSKARDGSTALMMAALGGHEAIAKALLDRGADPDERDKHDYSPITIVAESGCAPIARLLIAAKAKLFYENKETKKKPADIARDFGRMEVLALLEEHELRQEAKIGQSQPPQRMPSRAFGMAR